jgi:hypothetical protein
MNVRQWVAVVDMKERITKELVVVQVKVLAQQSAGLN